MIIRNDSGKRARCFGMDIAPGALQAVRADLPADKVAYLVNHFTVIDEVAPVVDEAPEVVQPTKKITKKKASRRTFRG